MSERTVKVAIDPSLHEGREPRGESERLSWEVLDTAWNLLREYSVRVTLASIRDHLAARGEEFSSDEEVFRQARESGDPDAPTSYLELAPENSLSAAGLAGAFGFLVEQAFQDASAGLGFDIVEEA